MPNAQILCVIYIQQRNYFVLITIVSMYGVSNTSHQIRYKVCIYVLCIYINTSKRPGSLCRDWDFSVIPSRAGITNFTGIIDRDLLIGQNVILGLLLIFIDFYCKLTVYFSKKKNKKILNSSVMIHQFMSFPIEIRLRVSTSRS